MNKLIALLVVVSFGYANKVYNISAQDYELYKNDNNKMIEVFKNRFLENKNKLIVKKDKEAKKTNVITKNNENKEDLNKLKNEYNILLEKNRSLSKKISDEEINKIKGAKIDDKFKGIFKKEKLEKEDKKTKNNIVLKDTANKNKDSKVDKTNIKNYIKMVKVYDENELFEKLTRKNIRENGKNTVLLRSINKILQKKKIKYDENEIKSIFELINQKNLSDFESNIYLKQIKELIKG